MWIYTKLQVMYIACNRNVNNLLVIACVWSKSSLLIVQSFSVKYRVQNMFQRKGCTITEVFLKRLSAVFFRKQLSNLHMPCVYILLLWRKNLTEMSQYKHKGYICLVASYTFITVFTRLVQKCCCFTCKAFKCSSEQFSRSVILTATCMPVGVCRAR